MTLKGRSTERWTTEQSSAVPVRCPDCGWRSERIGRPQVMGAWQGNNYGVCFECGVYLVPVPRRAEARRQQAKKEAGG